MADVMLQDAGEVSCMEKRIKSSVNKLSCREKRIKRSVNKSISEGGGQEVILA